MRADSRMLRYPLAAVGTWRQSAPPRWRNSPDSRWGGHEPTLCPESELEPFSTLELPLAAVPEQVADQLDQPDIVGRLLREAIRIPPETSQSLAQLRQYNLPLFYVLSSRVPGMPKPTGCLGWSDTPAFISWISCTCPTFSKIGRYLRQDFVIDALIVRRANAIPDISLIFSSAVTQPHFRIRKIPFRKICQRIVISPSRSAIVSSQRGH